MDYSGGTVVDLPPASSSNNTQTTTTSNYYEVNNNNDIVNTISKRKAKVDERKRELLLEARSARIEWIHSGGEADDNEDFNNDINNNTSATNTNLLNELQACTSDILPCAPQIIESMLSSNCDWRRQNDINKSSSTSRNNSALRQVIEKQNLSWKLVKKVNNTDEEVKDNDASAAVQKNTSLDLPSIPSSQCYTNFLNTLCEPLSANLVISIQQFCKTIHEAANVMVESMQTDNNGDAKESGDGATKTPSVDQHDHGTSLAKAVRGFINKTIREMEEHEAFHDYLYPQQKEHQQDGDDKPTINEAAREELLASLEKFVYTKSRRDIDKVLLMTCEEASKSMEILEMELHDKMLSLQFVTPTHLEIQSLKKAKNDIDLSYIIQQIQSIHGQSSPRQMLQCILSAHRGVSFALDKACGGRDPPGADDILPTLILATIRSHPKHLLSSLRFIEDFAPMPLLRGEMGYAYTNLCGALQFIRELDVDGHMAEVISLEGTGAKSAVLSIGPEEFRLGLELCRRKIEENNESLDNKIDVDIEDGSNENVDDESTKRSLLNFNIKARDVRKARSKGETIDLDWAIKKQNKSILQGKLTNDALKSPHLQQLNLPPEEPPLPSQFSRSYSFLTTHPDNIGIRDLPKLLKEYKMLVHATEKLLNERSVWREGERKRQMRAERHQLEQDFVDYVGIDENNNSTNLTNGH